MARKIYYTYNPDTDNFERVFPSLKTWISRSLNVFLLSIVLGIGIYFIIYFSFDLPSEKNLREENAELKANYSILHRRLENSLKVMSDIQNRDDNLYRVIFQMEPLSRSRRLAGLDNETRYRRLNSLSDVSMVTLLTQNMDLLERKLYAQSQSFDQIREQASQQKDKMAHIPAILPLKNSDATLSSGFGMRRDPISGNAEFHSGIDFSANEGTPVYSTADGVIKWAERKSGTGNTVVISHGYDYTSLYSHLSKINVTQGQKVKRGEIIGRVGSTGKSTGPHLHYEVNFKGEVQNPVNYFFMDLTPDQYSDMLRNAEDAGQVMD